MYYKETSLHEGGLAGHLSHVHEDLGLKFSDVQAILHNASEGKLEHVTEKTDGQNVFFSYNVSDGTLRFARNKGNIKTGGMTGSDVAAKWKDNPSVAKAFTDAYNVMNSAIASLDARTKINIFGRSADVWYSAEVISTANPNVINYDRNVVMFHDSGTKYDSNGSQIDDYDPAPGFQALVSSVQAMQSSLQKNKSDWAIIGPAFRQLESMSNKKPLITAQTKLKKLMSQFGVSANSTLADYAKNYIQKNLLKDYSGSPSQKASLASIIVSDEYPGIREKKLALKEVYPNKEEFDEVSPLINLGPKLIGKALSSIESVITEFAIEMLRGVQSQVALHPDQAVSKIKEELRQAIKQIESTNDEHALEVLSRQLGRLRSLDNVTTSMEGIVFKYNGKAYKLVGAFAPINQLLGFFRYGR